MAFTFERLRVYRLALEGVDMVWELAAGLPRDVGFALTDQLRRSSMSVVLNIAESTERSGRRDAARFIEIALGSLVEVVAALRIAESRSLIPPTPLNRTLTHYESLYRQLHAFKNSLHHRRP